MGVGKSGVFKTLFFERITEEGIPHVVSDFADSVSPVRQKRSLRPSENVKHNMPEAEKSKSYHKVYTKPRKWLCENDFQLWMYTPDL